MASKPRFLIIHDGALFHAMWQCHNKDFLFETVWAKEIYYQLILTYKDRYRVSFYSYTIMDNHVHLAGKMSDCRLFSDFFRTVNSLFAKAYNKNQNRCGQVVMDRFKSPIIQTAKDLIKVMIYLDLNPKRAGKVKHPRNNKFSSYQVYAEGKKDPLITLAPAYLKLAKRRNACKAAYRRQVELVLASDWRKKMPYSSALFIGDAKWVQNKMAVVKNEMRRKRREWKIRFSEKFERGPKSQCA